MDFLEKLNFLMNKNDLNKSTLSKACDIPYTTIDGWYKKGYEGLKLTTLRKLASFFKTSLDYWALDNDAMTEDFIKSARETEIIKKYRALDERGKSAVENVLNYEYEALLREKTNQVSDVG